MVSKTKARVPINNRLNGRQANKIVQTNIVVVKRIVYDSKTEENRQIVTHLHGLPPLGLRQAALHAAAALPLRAPAHIRAYEPLSLGTQGLRSALGSSRYVA